MKPIVVRLLFFVPPILWCGLIFFLSAQPGLASPFSFDLVLRKIAHLVVFGILFLLVYRSFVEWFSKKTSAYAAGVFSLLYAISDEIHQSFVLDRTAAFHDVLIDFVGILVAWWILGRIRSILLSRRLP